MDSLLPLTPIEPGEKVAACVQYTKKRKDWILAEVSKYIPETNEYVPLHRLNFVVRDSR